MTLIALTGGIGSGKSSVSSRLQAKGAHLVDSDELVKGLQRPGGSVFAAMAERWGDRIVAPDGTLDRAAVAAIVFADSAELEALNKLVHPAVRDETVRQTISAAALASVVIQDIPLLAETPLTKRPRYSGVVVVDTPPELAVERLVAHRGFSEADAWARIERQATREDRLALAGFVVDNSGTPDELDSAVGRLWDWILGLEKVPIPRPPRSDREQP